LFISFCPCPLFFSLFFNRLNILRFSEILAIQVNWNEWMDLQQLANGWQPTKAENGRAKMSNNNHSKRNDP